jgi:hypothetical protein
MEWNGMEWNGMEWNGTEWLERNGWNGIVLMEGPVVVFEPANARAIRSYLHVVLEGHVVCPPSVRGEWQPPDCFVVGSILAAIWDLLAFLLHQREEVIVQRMLQLYVDTMFQLSSFIEQGLLGSSTVDSGAERWIQAQRLAALAYEYSGFRCRAVDSGASMQNESSMAGLMFIVRIVETGVEFC